MAGIVSFRQNDTQSSKYATQKGLFRNSKIPQVLARHAAHTMRKRRRRCAGGVLRARMMAGDQVSLAVLYSEVVASLG